MFSANRQQLIDRLNNLYWTAYEEPGRAVDQAIELIRAAGISDPLETTDLLLASHSHEQPGSVTDLVLKVSR